MLADQPVKRSSIGETLGNKKVFRTQRRFPDRERFFVEALCLTILPFCLKLDSLIVQNGSRIGRGNRFHISGFYDRKDNRGVLNSLVRL